MNITLQAQINNSQSICFFFKRNWSLNCLFLKVWRCLEYTAAKCTCKIKPFGWIKYWTNSLSRLIKNATFFTATLLTNIWKFCQFTIIIYQLFMHTTLYPNQQISSFTTNCHVPRLINEEAVTSLLSTPSRRFSSCSEIFQFTKHVLIHYI